MKFFNILWVNLLSYIIQKLFNDLALNLFVIRYFSNFLLEIT